MTTDTKPLSLWDMCLTLTCDYCGAEPGHECIVVKTGRPSPMHAARYKVALAILRSKR